MQQSNMEFLKTFNFTVAEIKTITDICEGVCFVDVSRMIENCKVLVKYGYPRSDMDFLILANPCFLVSDALYLERKIKQIVANGDDLEELLKADPFLV